jgi:hypothetical protein
MIRDPTIQRTFETADDSLHGIIGYKIYVSAMQKAVDRKEMLKYLPEESFQTTFSWIRYYQKQHLLEAFEPPILELYQCKILLVALTSVFEAVLNDFVQHLHKKGVLKALTKNNYKALIEWAYGQCLKADIGEKAALERLPISFGIIDNARRLRNLFIHNNGLFNKKYEIDAIGKKGMIIDLHCFYLEFTKNPKEKILVVVDWQYLHRLILAHIEVLHILHNQIQSEFFGVSEGYSYAKEGKPIVFQRALWGNVNVRLIEKKQGKIGNEP